MKTAILAILMLASVASSQEPKQPAITPEQVAYQKTYAEAVTENQFWYSALKDADSSFSKELENRRIAMIEANDPRCSDPRFIITLAHEIHDSAPSFKLAQQLTKSFTVSPEVQADLDRQNAANAALNAKLAALPPPASDPVSTPIPNVVQHQEATQPGPEASRNRATALRQMERAMRTKKPADEAKAMRMLATDAPDQVDTFNNYLAAKSGAAIQHQNDQILRNQRDQAEQQRQIIEQQQRQLQEQQRQQMIQQQQARDRAYLNNANRRR